ncbi:undecaprenyl-diphosphate phosphatase [Paenibacillus sp. FSL R5-0887]|jgi:undecaprenyl-diphosphatase|uniref:Undecaprenyl-diphosphatase n=1 Tax=Paenibacillus odorifer TaxID=189426 RepID=A0A1R0WZQ6_9BACL|nr:MULTISPECIES: undecaprenyl-diphosphate phosphatase [Paenibacillus]AWV32683.1 undecaprenyl-diphosphatase [Paenibacillus odorifer]MDH6426187.1 undecaprenyl-diphosphatase [Paenibacillus sp. PastH-4]MDH6442209.1 undecaprenyl-diphosphatase [Paenibacillus sp. PastF-4]MDH6527077.1 undecaprenyl-diphosphatase [Paenibacillus sp. PastH-3]OMC65702.1 undecaprenyl-diphosphatase [Paenibacillus odorifer]
MDTITAIILAIVEGITEFIPVSSTGHMILTSKLLGFDEQDSIMKTYEIVIQLGAILAIALVYRERVLNLLGIGRKNSGRGGVMPASRLNLIHVILGIAPALAVAFFARDFIKSLFGATTVLWALVAGGILMIIAEWVNRRKIRITAHELDDLSYGQALAIGMYQIISVLWPGFSRSGSTISGGMLSGVSYKASADFSFLIAIPIMCAASGYEMLDSYKNFTSETIGYFVIGFLISFVVAYVVVILFMKLIQKIRLTHFAIYRFILAAIFWLFIMR